ncbi:MAG: hypothetical protein KDC95_07670 [Planctomycetes bacterium]|nr:hypothetical protein [Planctomycetota bacterium]
MLGLVFLLVVAGVNGQVPRPPGEQSREVESGPTGEDAERVDARQALVHAVAHHPEAAWSRRQWTSEDGLPANTVIEAVQTFDGYLWAATLGGLVRFDGQSFENLSTGDGDMLPSHLVTALFEDHEHTLWVGTRHGGVYRWVDRRFESVQFSRPGDPGWVRKIVGDTEGRVWVLADQLHLFRDHRLHVEDRREDPTVVLGDIAPTRDGRIWGFDAAGLMWIDSGRIERVVTPPDCVLVHLASDASGAVYCGGARLHRYDGEGWARLDMPSKGAIVRLFCDSRGGLWTCCDDGLFRGHIQSGGTSIVFGSERFGEGSFRFVCEDRDGTFWASPNARGLIRLKESDVRHLPTGGNSCVLAQDDALWFADREGLHRVRSDGWWTVPGTVEINYGAISSIDVDEDGGIWIAGTRQLGRVGRDGALRVFDETSGLSVKEQLVYVAPDRAVWVAYGRQLGTMREGHFDAVCEVTSMPTSMLQCADGRLLVGTATGVHVREGGACREILRTDAQVRDMIEEHGSVWIATYGRGLYCLGTGAPQQISSREGLANDLLQGIESDRIGNAWLNSNVGPLCIPWSQLLAYVAGERRDVQCRLYSGKEGNGRASITRGTDGRIWLSTIEGLSVVQPAGLTAASRPLSLSIERVLVDGIELEEVRTPSIGPGIEELEFHFVAVDLSDPRSVRYRYRLSGMQANWSEPSISRIAKFVGIPPGTHEFIVEARNHVGDFGHARSTLRFEVAPSLTQSAWFRWLALLAVAGFVIAGHQWIVRALEARNRRLELAVEERTSELREVNRELGAFTYTVSHDLRAPLRHINFYTKGLHEQIAGTGSTKALEKVDAISRATQRMSRLIDDLLTLARLARKPLVREAIDSNELVRDVWDELVRANPDQGHELTLSPLPPVSADASSMRHVWLNLLDNARKYSSTRSQPRVTVQARERDGRRWFVVRDNGVGFEPLYSDKLFKAFERLHTESEFPGTGVGLAICHRMITRHGGEIRGDGTVGEGAVFEFTLDPSPAPIA